MTTLNSLRYHPPAHYHDITLPFPLSYSPSLLLNPYPILNILSIHPSICLSVELENLRRRKMEDSRTTALALAW